ncbi:hypothetical protein [Streptomyces sp. NRRL S-146]|uniref:hypothetical protein n=1 Tax=Streptomyces sp. NRRL S-146 TaxID=1463884 RepID=UPI0004C929E0|nr:hypothetical protein [Streptomyces sp. NRRL S-146]
MKVGTVYETGTVGTAVGTFHTKREVAYVSARTYLGERTGEYVVSAPTAWGIALIVDNGPDGFDALDAVDDMNARVIVRGAPTGRDALCAVLGISSFRVDADAPR